MDLTPHPSGFFTSFKYLRTSRSRMTRKRIKTNLSVIPESPDIPTNLRGTRNLEDVGIRLNEYLVLFHFVQNYIMEPVPLLPRYIHGFRPLSIPIYIGTGCCDLEGR
jgi:hypothetical protein